MIKQNERNPISLFTMLMYQWNTFSVNDNGHQETTEANGLFMGAGIYRKIDVSPCFGIVPLVVAGHVSSTSGTDFFDKFINI